MSIRWGRGTTFRDTSPTQVALNARRVLVHGKARQYGNPPDTSASLVNEILPLNGS